ncbi:MAG TPA: class I SAM-dependent methyltransferase [Anaerolineae bacterium]|mgnify:CR=1 FL=1|nr:class I SAM-dependent methyltransferase [Anaerolineae bacterium]
MTMKADDRPRWPWRCPDCGAALEEGDGGTFLPCPLPCTGCGRPFTREEGLADLRPAAAKARLQRFADEYAAVRRAEGRDAIAVADLRALPWPGPQTPLAWEWLIRAKSYETFLDHALRPRLAGGAALRALDLGAGVGWLSHRLAWEGCHALALDVCADRHVGLGAARQLVDLQGRVADDDPATGSVTLALADFNHLPLADSSVDLVVFNAALHYSPSLSPSLAEAARVLAPQGLVVVLDSPFYEDAAAGRAMAAERRAGFMKRFGFASDALGSVDYLTRGDLAQAGLAAGLRWRYLIPHHGWRWTLRRAWRRRRLGRESAAFPVALAERL